MKPACESSKVTGQIRDLGSRIWPDIRDADLAGFPGEYWRVMLNLAVNDGAGDPAQSLIPTSVRIRRECQRSHECAADTRLHIRPCTRVRIRQAAAAAAPRSRREMAASSFASPAGAPPSDRISSSGRAGHRHGSSIREFPECPPLLTIALGIRA